MKRTLLPAVVLLLAIAGCTTVAPEPAPTPTPTIAASGDGVLRIGTLFALTGEAKFQGAAEAAGVELAVRDINQAGGVNGSLVEVFHRNGVDAETAEKSWASLTEKQVDVVIGPDSTEVAAVLVPLSAAAGIPLVSASSATADAVMSFSLASAITPSEALAGAIVASDVQRVFAITDDATDLQAAIETAGGEIVGSAAVTAKQNDFAQLVTAVTDAGAGAIVIDSAPSKGTAGAIAALRSDGIAADSFWFTGKGLRGWSKFLPADAITGSTGFEAGAVTDAGTTKLLRQTDPAIADTRYAVEAYDAVILAALAATLAADDGGPSIASRLRAASEVGIPCSSYGECLDVLTTESDIDYQGLSGSVDLGDAGSPESPSFTLYRYTAENAPEPLAE